MKSILPPSEQIIRSTLINILVQKEPASCSGKVQHLACMFRRQLESLQFSGRYGSSLASAIWVLSYHPTAKNCTFRTVSWGEFHPKPIPSDKVPCWMLEASTICWRGCMWSRGKTAEGRWNIRGVCAMRSTAHDSTDHHYREANSPTPNLPSCKRKLIKLQVSVTATCVMKYRAWMVSS